MKDIIKPVDTDDGLFHDGDPSTGTEGTIVDARIMNAIQSGVMSIQRELLGILRSGSIGPDENKNDQIVNALKKLFIQRNNPFSDIASDGSAAVSKALENLGLEKPIELAKNAVPSSRKVNKKALSGDITLTADDVAAVPSVIRGVINGSMMMASANKTGWWQVAVPDTSKVSDFPKKPNGSKLYGYGYMFVWVTGNTWFQHYFAHHGEVAYRQDWSAGPSASVNWVVEYNTENKPTAAEIDAVSASGGGTFKGKVGFNHVVMVEKSYPSLTLRDAAVADTLIGKDVLLEISGGNARLLFRKKDSTDNQLMLSFPKVAGTLYSTGNKPTAGDVGAYTKSEGDARYQPKGNYTPSGQAYTKNESDTRYNLKNTANKGTNGWHKDASTGLIIQFGSGSYSHGGRVKFPTAFPNACLSVTGNDTGAGVVSVALGSRNKTDFTMYSSQNSVSLNWIAIGY